MVSRKNNLTPSFLKAPKTKIKAKKKRLGFSVRDWVLVLAIFQFAITQSVTPPPPPPRPVTTGQAKFSLPVLNTEKGQPGPSSALSGWVWWVRGCPEPSFGERKNGQDQPVKVIWPNGLTHDVSKDSEKQKT